MRCDYKGCNERAEIFGVNTKYCRKHAEELGLLQGGIQVESEKNE